MQRRQDRARLQIGVGGALVLHAAVVLLAWRAESPRPLVRDFVPVDFIPATMPIVVPGSVTPSARAPSGEALPSPASKTVAPIDANDSPATATTTAQVSRPSLIERTRPAESGLAIAGLRALRTPNRLAATPASPGMIVGAAQPDLVDERASPLEGLRPRQDGGFEYRDPKTGFAATVLPDGSVQFRERTTGPPKLPGTLGQAQTWGRGFIDAVQGRRGSYDHPSAGDQGPFPDDEQARALATGDTLRPEAKPWQGPPPPLLIKAGVGTGDLAGPSTRKQQQAFLKETEHLRSRLRKKWAHEQREDAIKVYSRRVVAIWKRPGLSTDERKRQIFELWDDIDAADPQARARARERIEQAVRQLAPSGSPQAFTSEELAKLNAGRVSDDMFAPYR